MQIYDESKNHEEANLKIFLFLKIQILEYSQVSNNKQDLVIKQSVWKFFWNLLLASRVKFFIYCMKICIQKIVQKLLSEPARLIRVRFFVSLFIFLHFYKFNYTKIYHFWPVCNNRSRSPSFGSQELQREEKETRYSKEATPQGYMN